MRATSRRLKGWLQLANRVVKQAKTVGLGALPQRTKLIKRYRQVILEGVEGTLSPPGEKRRCKRSKGQNLLQRLMVYEEETLRFLHDFRVPFDNNLAKRDLRMTKVKLKVSGCFMSEHGSRRFARIRGYISTLRKNGERILVRLEEALGGNAYVPVAGRGG